MRVVKSKAGGVEVGGAGPRARESPTVSELEEERRLGQRMDGILNCSRNSLLAKRPIKLEVKGAADKRPQTVGFHVHMHVVCET